MHFDVLLPEEHCMSMDLEKSNQNDSGDDGDKTNTDRNDDVEENQDDEDKSDGEKASTLPKNLQKEFKEVYQHERDLIKQRATKLDFSGDSMATTMGVQKQERLVRNQIRKINLSLKKAGCSSYSDLADKKNIARAA